MATVTAARPRVTEEGISLRVGDRVFGVKQKTLNIATIARVEIPSGLHALSVALLAESALIPLSTGSDDEAINEAYGHDLGLLTRYRDGFKKVIDCAVLARAQADDRRARGFLSKMTEEIADVMHKPTLDLGAETLRLPRDERLALLQTQFRADVETLKQSLATWFHLLVESELVGVLEWINPAAVRYHYFRMKDRQAELGRTVEDPGMRLEGRTVTTTIHNLVTTEDERRVHTVVNVKPYPLDQFTERVPARIAELVDKMPSEVRQFARILVGNVTQEEVKRTVSSQVITEKRSVFVPDPTIALFDTFTIAGYGGTAAEPARSVYQGHALGRANKVLAWSLAATVVLAILAEPFGGIRGSFIVVLIGLVITAISQIGMRMSSSGDRSKQ